MRTVAVPPGRRVLGRALQGQSARRDRRGRRPRRRRDAGDRQLDQSQRDHVPVAAGEIRPPTTGSASSRRIANCRSQAIRRWAPAMSGSRSAASRRATRWSRNAAPGLVRIKRDGARLAFAAPPLRRSGEVEPDLKAQIARSLGIAEDAIQAAQWVDNGPGWVAVLLGSRSELLSLASDASRAARTSRSASWRHGTRRATADEAQFEVRGFMWPRRRRPGDGQPQCQPRAMADRRRHRAEPRYVAAQGTVLGRAGRVHVAQDGDDDLDRRRRRRPA